MPEKVDFDEEQLRDLRAPAVAADEWGGWVWVNMAGPEEVPSLEEWIGTDIIVDLGRYRMEDMILHEVLELDVPVSYKAVVDGFNEIYHATSLHNVGPAWTKSAKDTTFHVVNDHNYMCFVPRKQYREELAEDWDHQRYAICHYVVFPNTVFNCNPEHIQVFNPIPIDVDRTRFLCYELVYPGDEADPEYADYRRPDARPLGAPEGRRRRGHRHLLPAGADEAVEPVHAQPAVVARVQDRPLPRADGEDDPRLMRQPSAETKRSRSVRCWNRH